MCLSCEVATMSNTSSFCVFLKPNNKQIKVFCYDDNYPILREGKIPVYGREAALKNAIAFAKNIAISGYHCTIENFYLCDIGVKVFDTQEQTT